MAANGHIEKSYLCNRFSDTPCIWFWSRFIRVWVSASQMVLVGIFDISRKSARNLHCVPVEKQQNCFCKNFIKSPSIWIISDKKNTTSMVELCETHLWSTSPNLCQCTTTVKCRTSTIQQTMNLIWQNSYNSSEAPYPHSQFFQCHIHRWTESDGPELRDSCHSK